MKKQLEPSAFKEAFKNKRLYIITAVLSVVGLGVPFLMYGISIWSDNMSAFEYPLLMWAFVVFYILLGWVVGNSIIYKWRKQEAQYDGQPPFDVRKKSWEYRLYFFLPALIVLAVTLGFEICAITTGKYPFLDYDYSKSPIDL